MPIDDAKLLHIYRAWLALCKAWCATSEAVDELAAAEMHDFFPGLDRLPDRIADKDHALYLLITNTPAVTAAGIAAKLKTFNDIEQSMGADGGLNDDLLLATIRDADQLAAGVEA